MPTRPSRRDLLALYAAGALGARKPKVIVTFGDSTTAHRPGVRVYAERLPAALAAWGFVAKVINSGVPGDTTERARVRFTRDVVAHNPFAAVVQFGINDSAVDVWKDPPATSPRVALERFHDNLEYFLTSLRAHGSIPVLMTPNPLRWTQRLRSMYGHPPYKPGDADGFNVVLRRYVAAIRRLARQEGTELVDVFAAFNLQADPGALLLDGMHPNDQGHQLVTKLVAPVLSRLRPR